MEESILKADIFFFVTTIAVVVLTILVSIVLAYAIAILRDVQVLARRARIEAHELLDDLGDLRRGVRDGIETGVAASRAASRMVRPAGLKSAIGFLMNTIREAAGMRHGKKGHAKRKSPARDD